MKESKPKFVIKIDNGYYSTQSAWQIVDKSTATRLTHKEAYKIRGKLKRLGYTSIVEPA